MELATAAATRSGATRALLIAGLGPGVASRLVELAARTEPNPLIGTRVRSDDAGWDLRVSAKGSFTGAEALTCPTAPRRTRAAEPIQRWLLVLAAAPTRFVGTRRAGEQCGSPEPVAAARYAAL